jgi:hypothetical protein
MSDARPPYTRVPAWGVPLRYRKKPVEIDAIRWTGENRDEIEAWSDGEVQCEGSVAVVRTLEGELRGSAGDWIIRGVRGEYYPCQNEIFLATYEPVEHP